MDYKNTVFLPKTDFAMKAGLSKREPEFLQYWQDIKIYDRLRAKSAGRKKFILHFGPPYANGHIHIGHALSEVLKDIVNKTYQMMGYDAPMVPGWDSHGLPIEWKIEESYRAKNIEKDAVPPLEFIAQCRDFAAKWMEVQKSEFKRLGIIADWDNPYNTADHKSEAHIAGQLLEFLMNGLLYKGLKPVMWSVVEKTALAEAEVEYKDHASESIYVKFDVVTPSIPALEGAGVVIWTTTPWTLPGNRGIAFGPDFDYALVDINQETELVSKGQQLVIAKDLVSDFCAKIGVNDYTILETFPGSKLSGTICAHPWRDQGYDFDVRLLAGDHVTTETGTGLVHTAPGHGVEDFAVGQAYGLEVPAIVQDNGVYYDHVPLFAGKHVYKVAPFVLEELTKVGALLHASKLIHSYPHSWRSKTPLIFRATSQWFINVETLRDKVMQEIDQVEWFPAQGKNRISSMVGNRPDWCVSRQRALGVPITLFINKQTGEPLKDPKVNERIVQAIEEKGIEAWHIHDAAYFLKDKYDASDYEKVMDILDVWFDSGCSHHFVLRQRPELSWPADLYFEGSDQHRGWFQSSLLESVGTTGKAPYKQVVTHGFVLDEKGYKMSKSLGNVVSPGEVIDTLGADILRLWIVGSDYTQDLRIGKDILKHQEDIYRRFRNTLRYLLGALVGYTDAEAVPYDSLPDLEKLVLHQLYELDALHQVSVKGYDFPTFYTALHTFCSVDLSALYFDIRKDCLYCDPEASLKRQAARTVMNSVFMALVRWLAPVLSFTAEEAWQAYSGSKEESIHEQAFLEIPDEWQNEPLAQKWDVIRGVRRVILSALEIERAAKTIGSSLQAHVTVYVTKDAARVLETTDLSELAITSGATLVIDQPPANAVTLEDAPGIGALVTLADGEKCARCWRVLPEVKQESRKHPDICMRCEDAVDQISRSD